MRIQGKVKWFNNAGISSSVNPVRRVVHFSAITGNGFRTLEEGQGSSSRSLMVRKAPGGQRQQAN
jgi:cold shock CspA family protein